MPPLHHAMNDLTVSAIHSALRGLAARQRTVADNIANLETPGFLAGRVDFESSLRRAAGTSAAAGVEPSTSRSMDATGVNGNNVKLDDELVSSTETNLRYQLMVEAMSSKFRLLRTAIGSR